MLFLEYKQISVDTDSTIHPIKGYSRLLDPHGVSLELWSLSKSGHPKILPSITSTVIFDTRIDDGTGPDKRLIAKVREYDGG